MLKWHVFVLMTIPSKHPLAAYNAICLTISMLLPNLVSPALEIACSTPSKANVLHVLHLGQYPMALNVWHAKITHILISQPATVSNAVATDTLTQLVINVNALQLLHSLMAILVYNATFLNILISLTSLAKVAHPTKSTTH